MKALLGALTAILALSGPAQAATAVASQYVTVQVESAASLSLDSATVNFPMDSPIAGRTIAQTGAVNVEARARTSDFGAITLTALATSDLKSDEDTIPIDALSWSAAGAGYSEAGTLSDTQAQLLGSWNHSGIYDGTITYSLANEWDYAAAPIPRPSPTLSLPCRRSAVGRQGGNVDEVSSHDLAYGLGRLAPALLQLARECPPFCPCHGRGFATVSPPHA